MFVFSGKPVQGGAFQEKGGITSANAKEASLADIVREVRDHCLLKIGWIFGLLAFWGPWKSCRLFAIPTGLFRPFSRSSSPMYPKTGRLCIKCKCHSPKSPSPFNARAILSGQQILNVCHTLYSGGKNLAFYIIYVIFRFNLGWPYKAQKNCSKCEEHKRNRQLSVCLFPLFSGLQDFIWRQQQICIWCHVSSRSSLHSLQSSLESKTVCFLIWPCGFSDLPLMILPRIEIVFVLLLSNKYMPGILASQVFW